MIPINWRKNFDQILPKVSGAPDWLKARMEAIRNMPPPSLEEMQAQFRAGIEQRQGKPLTQY
jgi:hypothetical protein